jgi:uncharacterized membrane protein
MEFFYLTLMVILFGLAITNLMVGVTSNALNSIHSATGPNLSGKWSFLLFAGAGILAGTLFPTGISSIARTGFFHPGMFAFPEIMVILLAVMISDVILLDIFNATGIPSSSTIALVFELIGSTFAVSIVKISTTGGIFSEMEGMINVWRTVTIPAAILVSVVFAFGTGVALQFIARWISGFCKKRKMGCLDSVFSGLFLVVIAYFLLSAGFSIPDFYGSQDEYQQLNVLAWMNQNRIVCFTGGLALATLFMHLVKKYLKVTVHKIIVWAGTFALAMAFAGNDLAFYTGVPLAGYMSYRAWETSDVLSASDLKMGILANENFNPFILLFATGLLVVLTIFFSRKIKSFYISGVKPEDQNYGEERFGSSTLARILIDSGKKIIRLVSLAVPGASRPSPDGEKSRTSMEYYYIQHPPTFDTIRSSVNFTVSLLIITFFTYRKMPLSTVAVTLMAGMGSSLADLYWTGKNPVYKISALISINGGWILSAIVAMVASSFIAWIIHAGEFPVVVCLLVLASVLIVRTQLRYRRQSHKKYTDDEILIEKEETGKRIEKRSRQVVQTIISANKILLFALDGLVKEDPVLLEEALVMNDELNRKTKKQKNKIIRFISEMKSVDYDSGHFYIQVSDYQREVAHSLSCLIEQMKGYLKSRQTSATDFLNNEFRHLVNDSDEFFNLALHIVKEDKFDEIGELVEKENNIADILRDIETDEINRIKNRVVNSTGSLSFFQGLSEIKNLFHHSVSLIKSHRDFIVANSKTT